MTPHPDAPTPPAAPPTPPPTPPPEPEAAPELPRGCNPLVFGVIAATVQMAALLIALRTCR